jgi:nucleoside-diphosphate-sugar epimerase
MTVDQHDWAGAEGISTTLRIAVTGANGFVGSHLISHLEDHPAFDVVNMTQPADVIVSLAATADPRVAIADPVGAYENNVRVMVQTLEYARDCGARVLHVSTNEVYGSGSMTAPSSAPSDPTAAGKPARRSSASPTRTSTPPSSSPRACSGNASSSSS